MILDRPALTLAAIAVLLTAYRMWVIQHLGIDLYVDEAYYWGWSKALDWGYFSKPPVIAAMIAGSTALFGDGLLAIKLPSLLSYPLAALIICRLGSLMFDDRVGFWSGLAFLTMPLVGALGLFVSTDAPLLLFWSLGMLALWHALHEDGGWRHWLVLGLVVGLGLLTKYTMAAFLPSALLVMLAGGSGRTALVGPRPWVAVLIALLVFAPNLWWNWSHDFPTFRHTADITQLDAEPGDRSNLGEFLAGQWLSMGPLLFLCMLWAIARTVMRVRDPVWRMLLGMSLPLLALVSVQALRGGANSNWAAPAFVAGIVLTVGWLGDRQRWRTVAAAVMVNLLLVSAVYHWPDVARMADIEITRGKDPYKRARGWHEMAQAVAPALAAHPDAILVAPDRDLLAHLIYFLDPREYASWNPQGRVIDHYQLTTDLSAAKGRDLLFVSRDPLDQSVLDRFDAAEDLGERIVPVHRDFERRIHLTLLRGFRGYAAAAVNEPG
ncbi:MAG: glycosyltransferase family 39 protein [Rhodocyclaceae bacterium]|nr:glycosyltransferase family 39 protein [Rhodocyclaceae bacterium]